MLQIFYVLALPVDHARYTAKRPKMTAYKSITNYRHNIKYKTENIFSLIVKVYEPVKPTVHAVIIVLVYLIFIRKCIIVVPGLINGTERAVKEPRANKK